MKGLIYARVSTKEQADEGYSLSAQVQGMRDHTQRKVITVVKEFIVPESASGQHERKTFGELLTYLQAHPEVTVVVAEKVDRITRNFKDAAKLDDWLNGDEARQLHFVKQNLVIHKNAKSHEKFQWDIYLVLARQYSNNLSEEARKGLDEKARQGWYPGNHKRGYVAIGEVGRRSWVIDASPTSDAPFIRRAFELYDSGEYTLATLRTKLAAEGWQANISKAGLHKLITDCFYCGEFDWNGKHYTHANHQPLILPALFYQVQQRLTRNVGGKYRKHDFLFKNLIKCGECGRSVVGEVQKGHSYYRCTHYNTNCTQRRYINEVELEKQLQGLFGGLEVKDGRLVNWIRKALKESHSQEAEYHTKATSELKRQHDTLQKRLDALYDDKLDGKVTQEFFDRRFEQYAKEQKASLEALEAHQRANMSYFELGLGIFELSQKARQIYEKRANLEQRRALLNFVFSNLTLRDGNLMPVYKNAFQIIAARAENKNWLGRKDSNLRMTGSEPVALPLGYSPRSE